ncbi:MAG: hypothetical protein ACJATT_002352 [Myxococcota bacterium]|jgi:hypothetical protein
MMSAWRTVEVIMVMPLHTFSFPGVALQERVVYAIREEAHELSYCLERVRNGNVALVFIERLGVLADAWRTERLKLIREYTAARVRPSAWKVAIRHGQTLRELDLDTSLCVAHAWRWLRPEPVNVHVIVSECNTDPILSTSVAGIAELS